MANDENVKSAKLREHNTSGDENTVGFFSLPSELRIIIYSMLAEDVAVHIFRECEEETPEDIAMIENQMLPKCLLLSKKFKDEYVHQVRPRQTFVSQDVSYGVTGVDLRGIAKETSTFTFFLIIPCDDKGGRFDHCKCRADVQYHFPWIKGTLAQVKTVREIKFKLYVTSTWPTWLEHAKEVANRLQGLAKATVDMEMEMYTLSNDWETPKCYENSRSVVAKWKTKEGWQAT